MNGCKASCGVCYPIGSVVSTIHGNKLRRFRDGWSPLEGAHWDRMTVYSDDEVDANFALARLT